MGKPEFEFELNGAIDQAMALSLLLKSIRRHHDAVTDGKEDRNLEYATQLLTIAHEVLFEIMENREHKRMRSTDGIDL